MNTRRLRYESTIKGRKNRSIRQARFYRGYSTSKGLYKLFEYKRKEWSYETCKRFYSPLNHFHYCLRRNQKKLETLSVRDLQNMVSEFQQRSWRKDTKRVFLSNICMYLQWLNDQEHIKLNIARIFPDSRKVIGNQKLLAIT